MGHFWAKINIFQLFSKSFYQIFLKIVPDKGISEWAKVTVLDFTENLYYAQNGVNESSVRTVYPLLFRTGL